MYVDDCNYNRGTKKYRRILLRESYRADGKVKHKTIANISGCKDEEVQAIKIALKYKNNIAYLEKLASNEMSTGKKIGIVGVLYQIAQRLGIIKALGSRTEGLILTWLVFARLIDQGSRLSAVRLARIHAGLEIIGLDCLTERDCYEAMDWLYANRGKVERRLFREWEKTEKSKRNNHIFLYDVTSSYLEGN